MAKLISADELYKRRGVFADDIGKHGWREAINNLPAAEPERWIPCSEKLPVDSGWYIVTKNFAYDTTWVGLEWYNHENGWKYDNTKCIAWMPLPEPYKEE